MQITVRTFESAVGSQMVEPWPCPGACRQRGRAEVSTEAGLCCQRARCKGQSPAGQGETAGAKKHKQQ